MLHVYVDGACSGNGKSENTGGYGICVVDDEGNILRTFGKRTTNTTNNREELKAILCGLLWVGDREATIYSDSAYSLNTIQTWMYSWANKGWKNSSNKTPENLDLVKVLYDHMTFRTNIRFVKVKGHSGNRFNEIADAIASNDLVKLDKYLTMN